MYSILSLWGAHAHGIDTGRERHSGPIVHNGCPNRIEAAEYAVLQLMAGYARVCSETASIPPSALLSTPRSVFWVLSPGKSRHNLCSSPLTTHQKSRCTNQVFLGIVMSSSTNYLFLMHFTYMCQQDVAS